MLDICVVAFSSRLLSTNCVQNYGPGSKLTLSLDFTYSYIGLTIQFLFSETKRSRFKYFGVDQKYVKLNQASSNLESTLTTQKSNITPKELIFENL